MSKQQVISAMVAACHLLMLHFHIEVWFEFVRSDDNWSDGISRDGYVDPIAQSLMCNQVDFDWSLLRWPRNLEALHGHVRALELHPCSQSYP